MALREAHSTPAGLPRVEILPPNEQPRAPDGRLLPGSNILPAGYSKHWRPKALQKMVDECPDEWRECDRLARLAALQRVAEWTSLFGALSSGVCRLLMRAAEADADAQYFRVRAERREDNDIRAMADRRMTTARQCELMAWEIACRECDRRPKGGAGQSAVLEAELAEGLDSGPASLSGPPGVDQPGAPTASNAKPPRKRGRPRKNPAPAPERHAGELSDPPPTSGPAGQKEQP